jgi:hypothetical protein
VSLAALRAQIDLHCHGDNTADQALVGQVRDGDGHESHDGCGVTCGENGDGEDDGGHSGSACDTLGIRAYFSTSAVIELLADAKLPCGLVDAEMLATLTSGATVVATFGQGGYHSDDRLSTETTTRTSTGSGTLARHDAIVNISATRTVAPTTALSFTTASEGRVRVDVYDMGGRLVKTLVDEFRPAGQQSVAWNGAYASDRRVSAGVYLFRIQTMEGSASYRVAVVR